MSLTYSENGYGNDYQQGYRTKTLPEQQSLRIRVKDRKIIRPNHLSDVGDIGNEGIPDTSSR